MDENLRNQDEMSLQDELTNNRRDNYCIIWTWTDYTMDHIEEKDGNRSNVLVLKVHQCGGDF
jgi:hypothetical protein